MRINYTFIGHEDQLTRHSVPTSFNVYQGVPHGFRRHAELEASERWDKDHFAAIARILNL